jgi:hypothetical protein
VEHLDKWSAGSSGVVEHLDQVEVQDQVGKWNIGISGVNGTSGSGDSGSSGSAGSSGKMDHGIWWKCRIQVDHLEVVVVLEHQEVQDQVELMEHLGQVEV